MNSTEIYSHVRSGGPGIFENARGLIHVTGKEAIPFLDGMITNDMKTLADGEQMLAAFPNAQGRLLAVVRVTRQGDGFLVGTEPETHEKVFQNLFRFTFAGDFFVEDLSEQFRCFDVFGPAPTASGAENVVFSNHGSNICYVPKDVSVTFATELENAGAVHLTADVLETVRIENGIPKYGVDMDETTIVPEIGLDGLISYTKGCYIGQEIIARIHFRGHVAKRLAGVIFSEVVNEEPGEKELVTADGKNAGRITSVTYSPAMERTIALAYPRYDYLAPGTELFLNGMAVNVTDLPFID